MPSPALRVLVVDDHPVVRQGTRRILEEAGFAVVGEADTADRALELAEGTTPDVVLADVRLPGASGIELTAELRRRLPSVKVLVLSSYANPSYVKAALGAGSSGYMLKTASDEELVSAIRSVSLGATVLDAAVSAELVSDSSSGVRALTDRELEIVALVAQGLASKEVAANLGVSKRTVDAHLSHLFTKLGVGSRVELVGWATRQGLVDG